MMSGEVTAKEIALAHFLIADNQKFVSSIRRISTLHFVEEQLVRTMSNKSKPYKAAFVAYWINRRRPFLRGNLATAIVLGVALSDKKNSLNLMMSLADSLISGQNVKNISTILES